MPAPVTCGKGKTRGSQGCSVASTGTSGQDQARTSKTIQWLADPRHTEKVMQHLHAHPADCRVLFYSNSKSHRDGDCPTGKDKLSICSVIAKHVFEQDHEYAHNYADEPEKFRDSMNSHISK